MNPDSPLLECRGLTFGYGSTPVLRDISLSVSAGRFYGLVGPNGCGKTTLLDVLLGRLKPLDGEVLLTGRKLNAFSRREIARRVALAPQEFVVNFPFSVLEIILMGRHPHLNRFAAPSASDWEIVTTAIEVFGLAELRFKPFAELSAGEKQRVVLARTLVQDTPLILLDEPTSNLDIRHALEAMAVFQELVHYKGRTVLAVLHDLNLAAAHSDEIVFMKNGLIEASGPLKPTFSESNLARVFEVAAQVREDDFIGAPAAAFRKA